MLLTDGLLRGQVHEFQVRSGMVPVGGDVLQGKPERAALPRGERSGAEVHNVGVNASGGAGGEDVDGQGFALHYLPQTVHKNGLHDGTRNALIAGVRDFAVQVSDCGAHKVFRGAHFQIGKLQFRGVRGSGGRPGPPAAADDRQHGHHNQDDGYAKTDESPDAATFVLLRRLWLYQPTHGGIVLLDDLATSNRRGTSKSWCAAQGIEKPGSRAAGLNLTPPHPGTSGGGVPGWTRSRLHVSTKNRLEFLWGVGGNGSDLQIGHLFAPARGIVVKVNPHRA